ncbi:MAG: ATP-binding protein [Planctomycetes bacterium]|nr:ATP-binding protein [Planctomycetota bacterium]
MKTVEKQALALRAGGVFSPAAPIRERDVFAGRTDQLRSVIDAIHQKGQHVLIYGERGVGKTSLANVLEPFLAPKGKTHVIAPHINCDGKDDFASIWRKIFKQIPLVDETPAFGFRGEAKKTVTSLGQDLDGEITPDVVLTIAHALARKNLFIPIIDEFDRLAGKEVTQLFTDTIKALSDQSPATTIVLVGVADTVEQLIAEHQSVERALVQVRMPRMSRAELVQIVRNGLHALGMTIQAEANGFIATLSQGLPHYTHLLGLHSSRLAIDNNEKTVRVKHVEGAIRKAIAGAQQTLQRAYHQATISPRSDNLYKQALLACALADADQLGYFAAGDVRTPMSRIMKKPYEIAAFSRHLADFCNAERGPVLERIGLPRRYRFRFRNPLLQPFVIMEGLAHGMIKRTDLTRRNNHGA